MYAFVDLFDKWRVKALDLIELIERFQVKEFNPKR